MIHANFHDADTEKHVYLSGVLSEKTKTDLEEIVRAHKNQAQNWVFDLYNLELITSAGLRFFFETSVDLKATGNRVVLKNANQQIRDLIARSGLDRMVRFS